MTDLTIKGVGHESVEVGTLSPGDWFVHGDVAYVIAHMYAEPEEEDSVFAVSPRGEVFEPTKEVHVVAVPHVHIDITPPPF